MCKELGREGDHPHKLNQRSSLSLVFTQEAMYYYQYGCQAVCIKQEVVYSQDLRLNQGRLTQATGSMFLHVGAMKNEQFGKGFLALCLP
jgi:hypothetical protein